MKNFKYVLFIFLLIISIFDEILFYDIKDRLLSNINKASLYLKVDEQSLKIEDKDLTINIKIPSIYYKDNKDVERHINSYLRNEINSFTNIKRQSNRLNIDKKYKTINIDYHIPFKNKDILNIVVYKELIEKDNKINLYKNSYVFDLRSGQRIYLNHFINNEEKIFRNIENHIKSYIKENNLDVDLSMIKISKDTSYEISDNSININFNPYKTTYKKEFYEFNIPYDLFKSNTKSIKSNKIEANIDTQTITKDTKYLSSVINIPIIIIDDKDFQKTINDKITTDIMSFYNTTEEEIKNFYVDILYGDTKFLANVDYKVKKNSDGVISILINYYKYSGGAHGLYKDISYNIDTKQKRFLDFDDLFKQNSNYKGIIEEQIRQNIINLEKENSENIGIYNFKELNKNQKFYIEDDNLVLYFDLYDIAPYSLGIPSFKINISKIKDILKDEYIGFFK